VTPNSQVSAIRDKVADIYVSWPSIESHNLWEHANQTSKINAAEAAAKAQAKTTFPSFFKASERNSSITLAVDGGLGVLITGQISNGTDFFLNNPILPTNNLRIYPTDLVRTVTTLTVPIASCS
jgi:hypothetical protein